MATTKIYGQTKLSLQTEGEKIEYLINSIKTQKEATFYRNGFSYNASTAAKHLLQKWKKAANKIKTAEDFIEKLASKSSFSGKEYKIIFPNGTEMTTNEFLYKQLSNYCDD